MRRKRWLERKRMLGKKTEAENKEERQRRIAVEVVPDKAREALKKGLVLTNIKLS